MFAFNPFKSLTIRGVVLALVPVLVQAFDPGALGQVPQTILMSLGVLIAALGLRNAQAKGVAAVADLVAQLAAKK